MDSGRPSACALPMSIAQETLGRHAGALKDFLVNRKAVILLSGGLDSATVLALAREQGFEPYALSVSYGQRHIAELAAAQRVADALGAVRHQTMHVNLDAVGGRSEEHTSELQSLMRISYAVFCLKKKKPPHLTYTFNTTATT